MSPTYVLWSGRMQGWLSPGGTYVSRLSEARRFPEPEAFEYCQMHYANGYNEFGLIPVREDDLARCRRDQR